MEIPLLVLAVVVLPLIAIAAVTLLGSGAGRLYAAVMGRRQRRRRAKSGADIWTDAIDARRDIDALRARPDIDQSWTSWQRRDQRP
jgi:hypothetical protein